MNMLGKESESGMRVTFLGYIPEQVKFAGTDTPDKLNTSDIYVIDEVKRYNRYTKIRLEGDNLWYNSVHFRIT
jgi:hypothetical protein